MDRKLDNAKWLRNAYVNEGRSLNSIAKDLDCHANTVRNRLIAFSIARRPNGAHFIGKPKPQEQRQKMAEARRRYWQAHPDRTAFRLKVSRSKRHTGTMNGRPYIYVIGKGYVAVHRITAEIKLGRPLGEDEIVHHIDGDVTNNELENLQVMTNPQHSRLHERLRKRDRKHRFT